MFLHEHGISPRDTEVAMGGVPSIGVDGIDGPNAFSPIVNGHFRINQVFNVPPLLGVVGGTAEWLFSRGDVVSVTASAATSLVNLPSATVAVRFWRDIQAAYGLVDEGNHRLPTRPCGLEPGIRRMQRQHNGPYHGERHQWTGGRRSCGNKR